MTNKKYIQEDISDSLQDQEKLKSEEVILELPELKDIPGANRSGKNASVMPGDLTISSSDEEGNGLLDDEDFPGDENVSALEKKLLNESFDPSYDTDLPIGQLSLDEKDDEGDLLQEKGSTEDLFGADLDSGLVREEDEETEGDSQQ